MVEQRRFQLVTQMDFSGQWMVDYDRILEQAAATCPNVRHLKLGRMEPAAVWSDLARYLPKSFERDLRKWWKARPLTIDAFERTYILSIDRGLDVTQS